jgi:hypothetical protein
MKGFASYITEAAKSGGIQHLEHPSDRTFDGDRAAKQALSTLRGVALGRTPITRKIDDKMSFQIKREKDGRIGVKYKGSGAKYNYSPEDIEKQHGAKPYLAEPLKAILAHAHKVLPRRAGEWQGGFMSTPQTREIEGGKVVHTPNTIQYAVGRNTPEGKKLEKSKVSVTIHTELKGRNRRATPVLDQSEFGSHPDVHMVDHIIGDNDKKLTPEQRRPIMQHIANAQRLMRGHSYDHLAGHEISLRTYVNSTLDTGEKPTVQGYVRHLGARLQKEVDKVKTEKTKAAKAAAREAALAHIQKNKTAFQRTLDIHHHYQQATNLLSRALNTRTAGDYSYSVGGKKTGGEGFFAKGLKVVDRDEFSKLNRARSALLRAKK